ncbi:hypothetical protein ACIBSW_17095 [Actinoplanes sp. NPDC049668]|uniref:hypothetical protein n=1 Tax=unclassified Actinoplanes TaxID=2626549 RepID=UPI0033AA74FF
MNGIEYEEFLEFMKSSLAADHPELADLPVGAFARSSLQGLGVDSLALTELVIKVHSRWGREFSDQFLASPVIDIPVNWWAEVGDSPQKIEKGER